MSTRLRDVLLRRDTLRAFFRVLRTDGPIGTWRRGWAFIRRLRANSRLSGSDHPFPLIQFWSDMSEARAQSTSKSPALLTRRRVVAMIGDINLEQCKKYRVEQLGDLWETVGVEYRYSHWQDVPRATNIMQGATHLMLYRLARHDLVSMYLYEARRLRLPVLYDIDDPLFSVEAYATYGNMALVPPEMKAHFLSQAPLYLDVMQMADVMSFSTPGLRELASGLVPRPAFQRRNFADHVTLQAGRRAMDLARSSQADRPGFTLCVASGSQGHEADFQTILPQVERFLAAAPDRRLLVLGHFRPELLSETVRSRVETRPFTDYPTYLEHLAQADVAVMPLADDLFNRCKSGVRVIDAAAAGIPSITGTVGDLATLIWHGETGFVARTEADWFDYLDQLANNRGLAASMGRLARSRLEDHWSARASAPIIDPDMVGWVKG